MNDQQYRRELDQAKAELTAAYARINDLEFQIKNGIAKRFTLSWAYVGDELALFWKSPWSQMTEKIATFWWPAHPPAATEHAEKFFEEIANGIVGEKK